MISRIHNHFLLFLLSILLTSLVLGANSLMAGESAADTTCVKYSDYLHWVNRIENPKYPQCAVQYKTYIIAGYSEAGLKIFDISNVSSPTLISSLPQIKDASDIMLMNDVAVVSTDRSQGDIARYFFIDVAAPKTPKIISELALKDGSGFDFAQGKLYVSFMKDFNKPEKGLAIYDISDLSKPKLIGSLSTPIKSEDVQVQDGLAFLFTKNEGMQIVDVSNPAEPFTKGNPVGGEAWDIAVKDHYAYVVSGSGGIVIVDISDSLYPKVVPFPLGENYTPANRAEIWGHFLLVEVDSYIVVFDIENPEAPKEVNFLPAYYSGTRCISVMEGRILVAADKGIDIFDFRKIERPVMASTISIEELGMVYPLFAFKDNYLYCAGDVLAVVDCSTPSSPKVACKYKYEPPMLKDIALANQLLVGVDDDIRFIDISNPKSPKLVASIVTPGIATTVAVRDEMAFVGDGQRLLVVDIHDAHAPKIVGQLDTKDRITNVFVDGESIYVVEEQGSRLELSFVRVIDASVPTQPRVLQSIEVPMRYSCMKFSNGFCYISSNSQVFVYEVAESSKLNLLNSFLLPPGSYAFSISGSTLVAPIHEVGSFLVDIQDPRNPKTIGILPSLNIDYDVNNVTVIKDYFFASSAGLEIGYPICK